MAEKKLKIMVSSTVYHFKTEIEQLCATLSGYKYQVLNSHIGTIYSIPGKSPEESCLVAVNDAVKGFVSDAVNDALSDATNDAVIHRLINELLRLLIDGSKSLKELMDDFRVARATMQRDMALLKAHQFVVFEGSPKSGVYRLTEEFKIKIQLVL